MKDINLMAIWRLIRYPRFIQTPHRRTRSLWAMLAMLVLVGCGGASSGPTIFTGPRAFYAVRFTAATSYDAALQTVTNLGLQPGYFCAGQWSAWQPMGQRDAFAAQHLLVILPYDPPADWMDRVLAATGVTAVISAHPVYPDQPTQPSTPTATAPPPLPGYVTPTPEEYNYSCSLAGQPSTSMPLNASQAGTYVRVVFTRRLTTYGDALAVAVNLGLRLADPCREQATGQGTPPPWQSPGQATAFASTHALVVATMLGFTSNQWQSQLTQTPGVSSVQTPYTPECA